MVSQIFQLTPNIYIYIYIVGCSPLVRETGLQSVVKSKTQNMVLDASLHYTQQYKVRIKGMWKTTGKGVSLFPTLWCCSYWKGGLRVAIDNGRPTSYINPWKKFEMNTIVCKCIEMKKRSVFKWFIYWIIYQNWFSTLCKLHMKEQYHAKRTLKYRRGNKMNNYARLLSLSKAL